MCRPKIILSMTARNDTFEAYATVCGGTDLNTMDCQLGVKVKGVALKFQSKSLVLPTSGSHGRMLVYNGRS